MPINFNAPESRVNLVSQSDLARTSEDSSTVSPDDRGFWDGDTATDIDPLAQEGIAGVDPDNIDPRLPDLWRSPDFTEDELGYDYVDPGDFDFSGAADSGYRFVRPENPEGIESIYAPQVRDTWRGDWAEGEFRDADSYEGDWLTPEQFDMASNAEDFIQSLVIEAQSAGFDDVNNYMIHLSQSEGNAALFESHTINLNASVSALNDFGELYRFQRNISEAERVADNGVLTTAQVNENAMYFIGDLLGSNIITEEEAAILAQDPNILFSMFKDGEFALPGGPSLESAVPDFAYDDADINFLQPYVATYNDDGSISGYVPYREPGSYVDGNGALVIGEKVTGADGIERTIIREIRPDASQYGPLDGAGNDDGPKVADLGIHYYQNDPLKLRPYQINPDGSIGDPVLYPGEELRGTAVFGLDENNNSVFIRDYAYTVGFGDSTDEEQAIFDAYTQADLDALAQLQADNIARLNGRGVAAGIVTVTDQGALDAAARTAAENLAAVEARILAAQQAIDAAEEAGDPITFLMSASLASANSALASARTASDDAAAAAAAGPADDDDDDGVDLDTLLRDGRPVRTFNATTGEYELITDEQSDALRAEGIEFFANDPDRLRPWKWNPLAGPLGEGEWEQVLWANQQVVTTGANAGQVVDSNTGFVRGQFDYLVGRLDTLNADGTLNRVDPIGFGTLPMVNGVYDVDADAARMEKDVLHLFVTGENGSPAALNLSESILSGYNQNPIWAEGLGDPGSPLYSGGDWVTVSPEVMAEFLDKPGRWRTVFSQFAPGEREGSNPGPGYLNQVIPDGVIPLRYEESPPFVVYDGRTFLQPTPKAGTNDLPGQFAHDKTNEFFPGIRNSRAFSVDHEVTEADFDYVYNNTVQTLLVEELIDYMSEKDVSLEAVVNSQPEDIFGDGGDGNFFNVEDFITGDWAGEEGTMISKLQELSTSLDGSFGTRDDLSTAGALKRFAVMSAVLLEPIHSRLQKELQSRTDTAYTGDLSLPAQFEFDMLAPFDDGRSAGGHIGGHDLRVTGMSSGGYVGGIDGGMDDTIPAITDGSSMSALSSGEFVIPADVVSHLGDGNNQNGASKLYQLLDEVRSVKTGMVEQPAPINDGIVSNILGDNNG